MLTTQPAFGPLPARTVQFLGADRNLTELRGLVCRDEHMSEAIAALSCHLLARAAEWDRLQWSGLKEPSPARQFLDWKGRVTWNEATPSYWLPLPSTWEGFTASLTRNIKESLRKCYNSLRRDGYHYEFRVVASPAEVGEAVEIFFDLHASRANARDTVQHPDVFAGIRSRGFFLEYARLMAERDLLRIFQLRIGGEVVATRVGFALGGHLYLYYSGYDMRWRKYSVMTTVVAEAIKWAIEQRLLAVNLSTGRDVSKTRWRPQMNEFFTGTERSPTLRGQVVSRGYESCTGLARAVSRSRLFASMRRTT
jgi:CelD/BcsL family acetyltransferase involved in cellulose biosynthesis